MNIDAAKKEFIRLFEHVDGYEISRIAQLKLDYYYNANVYGEILFDQFYEILKAANPQQGEIFYDLGSGTGKPVILAALCFPFSKCIGVEKLTELYETSSHIGKKINRPDVEFIHSDFNNYDFTDGDVLYLNSYYFYYDMYSPEFIAKMEALKPGSRVIFVETPIIASFFQQIHEKSYTFSWGDSPVYIMQKK